MSADFTDASGITHTLEELIYAALYDKEAPLADRRRLYNALDGALCDCDKALDREQERQDAEDNPRKPDPRDTPEAMAEGWN